MPFKLLKKGKFIFLRLSLSLSFFLSLSLSLYFLFILAFPKFLEVHTSTPSQKRSFYVNFTLNPRAKVSAGAHRFCSENSS